MNTPSDAELDELDEMDELERSMFEQFAESLALQRAILCELRTLNDQLAPLADLNLDNPLLRTLLRKR